MNFKISDDCETAFFVILLAILNPEKTVPILSEFFSAAQEKNRGPDE